MDASNCCCLPILAGFTAENRIHNPINIDCIDSVFWDELIKNPPRVDIKGKVFSISMEVCVNKLDLSMLMPIVFIKGLHKILVLLLL